VRSKNAVLAEAQIVNARVLNSSLRSLFLYNAIAFEC
jgi:hypothetical protein